MYALFMTNYIPKIVVTFSLKDLQEFLVEKLIYKSVRIKNVEGNMIFLAPIFFMIGG